MVGGRRGGVYVPCFVPLQVVCLMHQGKFVGIVVVVVTVLFCSSAVLVTMEKVI